MVRSRRLLSLAAVAGLVALQAGLATGAQADSTDHILTVEVRHDVSADGVFDPQVDLPQAGIEIAVSDAAGHEVRGTTGADGRFELQPSVDLTGGHYFVMAEIPAALPTLVPVPQTADYAPLSTSVDVTSDAVTVRMAVQESPNPPAEATEPPNEPARGSDPDPAPGADRGGPRFAVGDRVWRDTNRSGVQDPGEPGEPGISVQLLDADGDVLASTITGPDGRYLFDDLRAGVYAVRFAGVPRGLRVTLTESGPDRGIDSDPDLSGMTAPFTLGVTELHVRAALASDQVRADYLDPSVDAGLTPLRYAVGDRVFLDLNADGVAQPDEPGAAATVSLLAADGSLVARTPTDPTGRYLFSNLPEGRYRLQFSDLPPHRRFTRRGAGSDPAADSDADPATGLTPVFALRQGAPNVRAAEDAGAATADFTDGALAAGLLGAYMLGDTVWLDRNGDGEQGADEPGVPGARVRLYGVGTRPLASARTTENGRWGFSGLRAGSYRVLVDQLPTGTVFTAPHAGDPARDSDVGADGWSEPVRLGDDDPDHATLDAGLVQAGQVTAVPQRGRSAAPQGVFAGVERLPRLVVVGGLLAGPTGLAVIAALLAGR